MLPRRTVLAMAALSGCATGPLLPIPRIDEQPCPPLDLTETRAVCSQTDAAGGIDVSVTPSTVSTAPEALGSVRLLVENGTDAPLRYDTADWRLYRDAGTGWRRREEIRDGPRDVETMPPGGSASWSGIDALFRLGADGRTPAGLYAAVLTVWPDRDGASGESVACVFLFRVSRKVDA
ncbi:hypothetical protein ACFR97_00275 [Haloplanus litoreus]|uniref:Intracellular proteinase inhibitor n=1 Tax=Haloplanus litoreus TaxID=767515 RepID=A0ABD5ZVP3_9EURY